MTKFEDIYEIAVDNYGIITASQAAEIGVTPVEMKRYADTGRLVKRGRGVYRLDHWVPTPYDRFAEAVALVGDGAALFGESVLALLGLASSNPAKLTVATPKRVRKALPSWIAPLKIADVGRRKSYQGIPSQHVSDAILACRGSIMDERLLQAVADAQREGWIASDEARKLRKELKR